MLSLYIIIIKELQFVSKSWLSNHLYTPLNKSLIPSANIFCYLYHTISWFWFDHRCDMYTMLDLGKKEHNLLLAPPEHLPLDWLILHLVVKATKATHKCGFHLWGVIMVVEVLLFIRVSDLSYYSLNFQFYLGKDNWNDVRIYLVKIFLQLWLWNIALPFPTLVCVNSVVWNKI